jgi:hypothetical protein
VKPKIYKLIEECVESGVIAGINRAYKHADNPTKSQIYDTVIRDVMLQINEWFDFEEPEE